MNVSVNERKISVRGSFRHSDRWPTAATAPRATENVRGVCTRYGRLVESWVRF